MIVDLVVDGARFTVTERPGSRGVHIFVWRSGPNPGYGFTMAAYGAGPVGAVRPVRGRSSAVPKPTTTASASN